MGSIYERLYEEHAQALSDEEAVGGGDFAFIGRLELRVLQMVGLEPTHTLVDFGCGTGRLAVQVIPWLTGGRYIGVDISQSLLDRAQRRVETTCPAPTCRVEWLKQVHPVFPLASHGVDHICAFSVFTHMEHEDSYRYLKDALRVVRPGGRFTFSCLPLDLLAAQAVFLKSAEEDFEARWGKVRNVTTSMDLMEAVARLAGWIPQGWYRGDVPSISFPEETVTHPFGQSICVLAAPSAPDQ